MWLRRSRHLRATLPKGGEKGVELALQFWQVFPGAREGRKKGLNLKRRFHFGLFWPMESDNIECISVSDGMVDNDEVAHVPHPFLKPHGDGSVTVIGCAGDLPAPVISPVTGVHQLLEFPVCTNSLCPPIHQVRVALFWIFFSILVVGVGSLGIVVGFNFLACISREIEVIVGIKMLFMALFAFLFYFLLVFFFWFDLSSWSVRSGLVSVFYCWWWKRDFLSLDEIVVDTKVQPTLLKFLLLRYFKI